MKLARAFPSSLLFVAAGLSVGLSSLVASAMPPVLERVPDDAAFVLAVPAPQAFEKNLNAFSTAIEFPFPIPTIQELLLQSGMGAGVDATKSFAIVGYAPAPKAKKAPKPDADAPREGAAKDDAALELDELMQAEDKAVILVPVTSFNEFITGLGGKPDKDGPLFPVTLGGGSGFAKDIGGGYAALSEKKDVLENFTGKSGADPLSKRMGKPGEKLADDSDLVAIVNMTPIRPLVPGMIEDMKKGAKEQAEMFGQQADMEKQLAGLTWLVETVTRDTQALVTGIKFSSLGVSNDTNASFIEGSNLAKAFTTGGQPSAGLAKLPAQPFLFAGGVDISNPAVKQLFKDIIAHFPMPGGDAAAKSALATMDNIDAQSVVVGFPMGGAISGILTSSVLYMKAKDPAAALQTFKQSILDLNGKSENGVTIKSSVVDGGAKAGNTPVDVWDMKMTMKGEGNEMATQGMAFIFGPQGGPGGYVAKTDSGIYTTYAKNSDLMTKSLAAGAGQGETMSGDQMIAQVAQKMPPTRLAEGYVGIRSIMDLVLPFAGMAGVQVPMDKIPTQLPPIGMSIASDQGQGRISFFVPAPVIKTGLVIGQEVMDQFNGMGEDPDMQGGEDGGKPPAGGKTGQPRF